MKQVIFRGLNHLQAAGFLPPSIRRKILRAMGLKVADSAVLFERSYFGSKTISIEDEVFISVGCFLDGSADVHIGHGTYIAPYAHILTSTHEIGGPNKRAGKTIRQPVSIGEGCWIGAGATIMPGVVIANGCIIAARAVLTKNTEPNGLYVGIPAKRAKDL